MKSAVRLIQWVYSFSVRNIEARVLTAVRVQVTGPIACGQRAQGQKGKHKKILLFTSTWTASHVYDTGCTFSTLQGMGFQPFLWQNAAGGRVTSGLPHIINYYNNTIGTIVSYCYSIYIIYKCGRWQPNAYWRAASCTLL